MDVRLLGPVEVSSAGVLLRLGGPRQRAVLAALALHSAQTVSAAQLIDDLWGDRPPASAKPTLETYVSRLRQVLGAAGADGVSLVTRPPGYLLQVVPDQLDICQFRDLAARGGDALARGDAADAVGLLSSALGLWRGPALADIRDAPFAAVAAQHLEEERLTAREKLVEAKLGLGLHREVVPELEALVAGSPYRERFHAQLMLALYRSGRQAEALTAFSRARDVLAEDLGIEPGRELRELQHAVLVQAHELDQANAGSTRSVGYLAGARSDDRAAPGLPVQLTNFIGRDAEMAQVRGLLTDSRLVTLTGAGGVGKTRLALQVAARAAAEFPAGVWQVDLAPVTDGGLVPLAVARALRLPDEAGRQPEATVAAFISAGRAMMVLDNCEHVLEACAVLTEHLLRSCQALVVLATSREPLGVAAEATWRVPSLSADEATQLFTDRARRARPGFSVMPGNAEAVAEICRRLDGLPLAIELAAARLRAFSPAEIAAGLQGRFQMLTSGSRTAVTRHQTLQASVDWSHALLSGPERVLFRRLAVFAGGFDLAASQAVGSEDGLDCDQLLHLLALLVDKSLVVAEESQGATRYRLLETIRQYAAEKLAESGEASAVRTRHRRHYTALASRLVSLADNHARRWIAMLEGEIGNTRAAFEWSLEISDSEAALQLASSLQPLWLSRFRTLEGLAWFDAALDGLPAGAELAPEVRVQAVADAAVLGGYTDSPQRRKAQSEEGLTVARQLGEPALLARALLGAGYAAGRLAQDGRAHLEEANALARQVGDVRTLAQILGRQAFKALNSGDLVAARLAAEEGLALADEAGNDHTARHCRTYLGAALAQQGDLPLARSLLSDLVAEAEAEHLLWWKAYGLGFLGQAAACMGEADAAREAGEEAIAIADDLGLGLHALTGYAALSLAAMACGDRDALVRVSQAGWQRGGFLRDLAPTYHCLSSEADLAAANLRSARQQADRAVDAATRLGMKVQHMRALIASARVAATEGDVGRAREEAHHALIIGRSMRARPGIADALECLGALTCAERDQRKAAAQLLGAGHAIRRATCYQRFALYQDGYDAAVLALRASLGEAAFSHAFDEGAGFTVDYAVSHALARFTSAGVVNGP